MDWWRIVCCAAAGYLLGSCNGAIVVSHTCMHDDIRKKGSGNAGLTNFLRNFGGWATLLVVLMDMGKVVLACLLGRWLLPGNPQLGMMIAGAMTELGHIFPVFYGFRGGKGVLCAETMLLIVSFPTGLVSLLIFVGIVWATRYVSLGSVCGALIAPIGVLAACGKLPALLSLFCVILLVAKHRSNIRRLIEHKESKLSFKKDLSDKFDDEDF